MAVVIFFFIQLPALKQRIPCLDESQLQGTEKNPIWNFPLSAVLWTKRRGGHEKFENNLMVHCAMPLVWGWSAPSPLSIAVLCPLLQGQTWSSPSALYLEQHMTHLKKGKLATIAFIYSTGAKGQIKHLYCIQSCPDSTRKVSCPCSTKLPRTRTSLRFPEGH